MRLCLMHKLLILPQYFYRRQFQHQLLRIPKARYNRFTMRKMTSDSQSQTCNLKFKNNLADRFEGNAIIRSLPAKYVAGMVSNGNENEIILTLDIKCNDCNDSDKMIHFQMNRRIDKDQSPLPLLRRMETTAMKHLKKLDKSLSKHSKKCRETHREEVSGDHKNSDRELMVSIQMIDSDTILTSQELHRFNAYDLWSNASRIFLPTLNIELNVIYNPPTLVKSPLMLSNFGQEIFVGVPLALGDYELKFADYANIIWKIDERVREEGLGEIYHSLSSLTPQSTDIGKHVSVTIIPRRHDFDQRLGIQAERLCKVEFIFEHVVKILPDMPILHPLRSEWTKKRDTCSRHNLIRIMTYNILASLYVRMESIHLYGHVSKEYLRKEWRLPLLAAEILAFDSDIICLQEVDNFSFKEYISPLLLSKGYDGYFSSKVSVNQSEGCAMFWKVAKFDRDFSISVPMRDLFQGDSIDHCSWESMKAIDDFICRHDDLREIVSEKVGTVLQVVRLVLKEKAADEPASLPSGSRHILVANTHLFFHPLADHVRVIQCLAICAFLDQLRSNNLNCPLLLCGDLNSDPTSGAFRLLLNRELKNTDKSNCWKYLNRYKWDDKNENESTVEMDPSECDYDNCSMKTGHNFNFPPNISIPESFPPLFVAYDQVPEFTNYSQKFQETLDYIFASEPTDKNAGFKLVASAPMMDKEVVEEYISMPNRDMPSDHVSVVSDLLLVHSGEKI